MDITTKIKNNLHDEHTKMLNLGHDWLTAFLPFVLQKVSRVHFGLLQPADIQQLEDDGVKIPTSRKLVAVPFVAKDVPSRASGCPHMNKREMLLQRKLNHLSFFCPFRVRPSRCPDRADYFGV